LEKNTGKINFQNIQIIYKKKQSPQRKFHAHLSLKQIATQAIPQPFHRTQAACPHHPFIYSKIEILTFFSRTSKTPLDILSFHVISGCLLASPCD
jgi:hypothetical protein